MRSGSVSLSRIKSFHVLGKEIYQWLSAPDPSRNYHEAREKHYKGTCSWLVDGGQLAEWKTKPDQFLWLYGMRK